MDRDIVGDELVGDELGDDLVGALDEYAIDDLIGGDDSIGDSDIMGDDLVGDYLVGAGPRRRKRRLQNAQAANILKRAMLAKRLNNAKLVKNRAPTKNRIQSIGFTRTQVPANTSVEITARPQVLFRGTRLLVGSSIAASFVIEDIKVGRNSQFVATGAQPAEAFKDTATGENVALDTCKPGVDLTLIVTNTTAGPVDFRASLFGDVVE